MVCLGQVNLQGDSITTALEHLKEYTLQRKATAGMFNTANYTLRQSVRSSQIIDRHVAHLLFLDSPQWPVSKNSPHENYLHVYRVVLELHVHPILLFLMSSPTCYSTALLNNMFPFFLYIWNTHTHTYTSTTPIELHSLLRLCTLVTHR
jgi:hypothetical protein